MRLPLSWLREYVELPAALAPRRGRRRPGPARGRGRGGRAGRGRPDRPARRRAGAGVRGAHRQQRQDRPVVPGRRRRGRAARDRLRRAQLRRGRRWSWSRCPARCCRAASRSAPRKTYGHVSDGMICSARELGLGDDHAGILVLAAGRAGRRGRDRRSSSCATRCWSWRSRTDRGYELSVRGIARELSHAFDAPFRDPAGAVRVPDPDERGLAGADRRPGGVRPLLRPDGDGARPGRAVAAVAAAPAAAGRHPLDLAGRRRHQLRDGRDRPADARLRPGEALRRAGGPAGRGRGSGCVTLDGVERALDPDDLLVTDESGPLALAGIMGGASTEIGAGTTDVVLEAAHWDPPTISRGVRRHKLPSEAAKRFERAVDPEVAGAALERACRLLARHGGADTSSGFTVVGPGPDHAAIILPVDEPAAVAGMPIAAAAVMHRLEQVGCTVAGSDGVFGVIPPSWRPDLVDPADLVEEVVRLEGYDKLPVQAADPPAGPGAHRGPAGPPLGRPGARRAGLRRGAVVAVRRPGGARRLRPGRGRPAPARPAPGRTRSRTPSRSCAPRCCPGCCARCAATSAGATGTWRSTSPGWSTCRGRARRRCRGSASTAGRPPPSWAGWRPGSRPAEPPGRRPRRRPGPGRVVGSGAPRRLGRRGRGGAGRGGDPAGAARRPVGPAGALAPRPVRVAAARRPRRRLRRRAASAGGRRAGAAGAHLRDGARPRRPRPRRHGAGTGAVDAIRRRCSTSRSWSRTGRRRPTSPRRCATAPGRCSSRCGCSTSTPTRSGSGRAGGRWRTRCASGRRTGR